MKRVLLIAIALGALVVPPAAQASLPSYQDRLDAKRWARAWWASRSWNYGDGTTWCRGVRFRFRSYYGDPNIRHTLAYQSGCTITFNKRINWASAPAYGNVGEQWWRFCVTAIHEYGHLPGMPYSIENPPIHSWNPNNVMAANEELSTLAWWWPHFPGCSYQGDGVYSD
jgi:hypothetical protein